MGGLEPPPPRPPWLRYCPQQPDTYTGLEVTEDLKRCTTGVIFNVYCLLIQKPLKAELFLLSFGALLQRSGN